MIPTEILLMIVAGIAFYVGYRMGRMSAMAELDTQVQASGETPDESQSPLPAPGRSFNPPKRNSAPPPAAAGEDAQSGSGGSAAAAPRRTASPPPARAGLLDPGGGKKGGK